MARIAAATIPGDLELVRELWREWAEMIGDPGLFARLEDELAHLNDVYGPPNGVFMLAWEEKELAGGGALRRIDGEHCEMLRVYTRPRFRGRGLARTMSVALMGEARRLGYEVVRFSIPPDFTELMSDGIKLYESLGFRRIPAYGASPPGAVCMEARVRSAARK